MEFEGLTRDDLGTLEILIGVNVAWRDGEIDPHQQEQQIGSTPHPLSVWY